MNRRTFFKYAAAITTAICVPIRLIREKFRIWNMQTGIGYATITDAVDDADPGDLIEVRKKDDYVFSRTSKGGHDSFSG